MKQVVLLLALCVLAVCVNSYGQVPQKMSYQGMLTTSFGTPVADGSYGLRFDIYNASAGGTLRHTVTHASVSVQRGTFSVILTSLPGIFGESLFVEVTAIAGPGIGSPITFSPRSELTSSPYALRADTSNYASAALPGGPAGGDLSGTFPNPTIASNAVALGKINPSGSTSGQAIISTGPSSPPIWNDVAAGTHAHDASDITSGTMLISRGGTNNPSAGASGAVAYSDGSRYAFTGSVGTNGQLLRSSGGGSPTWGPVDLENPNQITGTLDIVDGGTGATTASNARLNLGAAARGANSDITSLTGLSTALAVNQGGTGATTVATARFNLAAAERGNNSDITSINGLVTPLSANQGGTGVSNYTTGDLLYATGSTALSKLSDVATGNALISGGVGTPPLWGKIGLTSHVTGTLPVSNGGTGNSVPGTSGSLVYYSGPGYGYTAVGTANQHLKSSGGGAPTWGAVNLTSPTEISGTLPISNGGTGSAVQNFVDLTTVQTANGNKTFGGNTTFQGTVTVGAGVNPGAPIFYVWSATANLGFPPTAAWTSSDMFVPVNGAQLGDVVMLGVPNGSVLANSAYTAWVSAPNQVTVRFNNYSPGGLFPAMGVFRVAVMRF